MPSPITGPDARTVAALAALAAQTLSARGGGELWSGLKRDARALVARDPMDAGLATALSCAYLFWLAERDENPKVQSFWDALVFVTTCFSVGYSDVFARTDGGKAIASFAMTVGPSLAASFFAPPAAEAEAAARTQADGHHALLSRLDAILAALQRAAPPPPPA